MRYVWSKTRETWVPVEETAASPNIASQVGWPIISEALQVHAKDVKAYVEDARKRGVPTEFKKDGRPVLRDRAHRKAYLRAYGLVDRNSFTGY